MTVRGIIILVVLLMLFLETNGQVKKGVYLFNDAGNKCFVKDSANNITTITKVIRDTYIISYSFKFENKWSFRPYYDELRISHFYTYNKNYDIFSSKFLDTAYYWTRYYPKCCGIGTYRDYSDTKTICAQKINGLYNIVILNYEDEIIQIGKSKYMYPFVWEDTVSFYQDDKLFKQIAYNQNEKTTYFDKKGNELELIHEDSIIEPKFLNSNRPLFQDLRWYFSKSNSSYPSKAMDNDIAGNVYVWFIITKEGEIECVEDLRRVPILSDICIEKIKSLPKLKPATLNGEAVNYHYAYTFRFHLD